MRNDNNPARTRHLRLTALLAALGCMVPLVSGAGNGPSPAAEGPCSTSAQAARIACLRDAEGDYFLSLGKCANVSDADQRARCVALARLRRDEAPGDCFEQFETQDDFCDEFGQGAYDPVIDPADFVDPADIGHGVAPNPYFPLVSGSTWTYVGGGELNIVRVTGETRELLGVTCAIVHDVVAVDGEIVEDTDDYFAQDEAGNVWYFGEVSQELEDGFLVSLEGSWQAGSELAKPGIAFEAAPRVGDLYRQEFALGEAEDGARVLSTNASASVPAASCEGTCVLTEDFNLLEPDSLEHKYYAPGIGFILETDPDSGERLELVDYQIGAN
jgi:hypothetical protein